MNHLTHVKVADPLGIFTVSLLSFMWLSVFRVRKSNKQIILLQDIKNRDPVFAGGFHTNVGTIVFSKPINQLLQPFGKGREASLLILGTTVCISNPDASIDPCFVDIQSTAIKTKNFERQKNNLLREYSYKTDSDWSSGKIESTLEEISLRATVMRHSLMP